jgi:hypothetical protein
MASFFDLQIFPRVPDSEGCVPSKKGLEEGDTGLEDIGFKSNTMFVT